MTKMTAKGQVTIPKRLRDHLGLKPGSEVKFEFRDDGEVVIKSETGKRKGRFDDLVGSTKFGMTTDELMRQLRGSDE
ncbi:MAG: AbrB/MazE/SpoVT family DNA-binding domain-containing protein [Alphaproteobacteria bacterium]|nr:AbrB/MazE/SpoVT family DNA-binding domain-containing protein [Alphaproteobacteria bacterium]